MRIPAVDATSAGSKRARVDLPHWPLPDHSGDTGVVSEEILHQSPSTALPGAVDSGLVALENPGSSISTAVILSDVVLNSCIL